MHDQPTPVEDERTDAHVLDLLLDCDRLWAVDEVAREVGDRKTATDALGRLARAGLVHRLDGFVFPTRPAVRATRLAL